MVFIGVDLIGLLTLAGFSGDMTMIVPPHAVLSPARAQWCAEIFAAKAAAKGGIVRRAVRDVEREIGREVLLREVRRRGFHLIETGGQFIIVCNSGLFRVLC
jgi:hypothetical protein